MKVIFHRIAAFLTLSIFARDMFAIKPRKDAIHTVKPYFGLGANSALEDVQVSPNTRIITSIAVLLPFSC